MKKSEQRKRINLGLDPEEFFRDARPNDVLAQVEAELEQESQSSQPDPHQVRQDETWNFLANKIVGSELGDYCLTGAKSSDGNG